MCGQVYDGAAAMSGHIKGVQIMIAEKHPAAKYVHCASHNLHLCLSSTCGEMEIRNCLGIIEKYYWFFDTPKRLNILQSNIDLLTPDSKKQGLKKLSPIRWVERHDAVLIFEELYEPLFAALEEIEQWPDRKASSEAPGLLASLKTAKFVIGLYCLKYVYAYTLPLSKVLQSVNLNLCEAIILTEETEDKIKKIRVEGDEIFDKKFIESESLLKQLDVVIKAPRLPICPTQRLVINADSAKDFYKKVPYFFHFWTS
nr:unnamed protein product [Callosobruchus analis]